MSHFHLTTILATIVILVSAIFGHGETRITQIEAIVIFYVLAFAGGMAFISLQYFVPTTFRGGRGRKQIALTFDDGPDPFSTPALLDLLKEEKIPATFFCIGRNVVAYPEIARRIVDEGHLIGNHSHHHSWTLPFYRTRSLVQEYNQARDVIERITDTTPQLIRPPVGITNPHYGFAVKRLGVTVIAWDVRPLDTFRSAKKVIRHVLSRAKDGSIILLHDGGASAEKIAEIVGTLVKELRAKGYEFERVDRMI